MPVNSERWKDSYAGEVQIAFRCDPQLKKDFKQACQRNKKDMQIALAEAMRIYIKDMGAGGPLQQMDQFFSPEYMPTPAFFANMVIWQRYLSKHCNFAEIDDVERRAYLLAKTAKKAYYIHANTVEGRADKSIDKRKLEAAEKTVQDEEEQKRLVRVPKVSSSAPAGVVFELPQLTGEEEVVE